MKLKNQAGNFSTVHSPSGSALAFVVVQPEWPRHWEVAQGKYFSGQVVELMRSENEPADVISCLSCENLE